MIKRTIVGLLLFLGACSVGGEVTFQGIVECYGSEFDERATIRFDAEAETTVGRAFYGNHEPYGIITAYDLISEKMIELRTDHTYPNNLSIHCKQMEDIEFYEKN